MFEVEAVQGAQQGNHQGVRSLEFFGTYDPNNPACIRVSNLAILSGGSYIEWGWLLGWSLDHSDGNPCTTHNDSTYHDSPLLFVQWKGTIGGTHCRREGEVAGGANYTVTIKNGDGDTDWIYLFEGSEKGHALSDFSRGRAITNVERHRPADSGFAEFDNLAFQVAGSTTFYDWNNLRQDDPPVDDPDWHCRKISDTHHTVRMLSRTCPYP